jgi:DNA-binding LacI/PurR family transcriptional regulator
VRSCTFPDLFNGLKNGFKRRVGNVPSDIKFNNDAPLYEQIEKDIKRKIKEGVLKPGDNIGSQNELSELYSVSTITIKRALSNLVNDKILYTRVGLGTYVADEREAGLNLSRHRTIGLVLRDLNHQYFSMIVNGIEERAYELGYNVLLSSSSNKIEKEENQITHFQELGVDGLIIASLAMDYRATDYIRKLHEDNFPYIMVSYIHDPEYWYVGTDHESGGFMATEHLIKLGYRSIGYVHVEKGNLLSEVRKNGYSRALTEYDRPFDSKLIFTLASEKTEYRYDRFRLGYEFGKSYKTLAKRPDALFFYSDLTALGFEQAAIEEGFGIPKDVAIVGFDDIVLANYASIPLTTVHQPADKIGKMAVDILQKRVEGSEVGNRTILKPSLVIRDSCGSREKEAARKISPTSKTKQSK